jgi:hypothetical protein
VAWVVYPKFKIVIIHRPDRIPKAFSSGHEIADEPYLPGFRVVVSDLLGSRTGERS